MLNLTKLKKIEFNNSKVTQVLISVFDTVENNVGKGENTGKQHCLLFSQCFQKPSLTGLLKLGIVWIEVK